jgi:AsmA protein
MTVNLKITDGEANIEDVRMDGPSVALDLTGSASIPARELDLKGTASLLSIAAGGANIAVPAFELPFMVRGPWDDPIILPDPQSRMQRSGAARPILDAVKDRSTRDAVRSAIERLMPAQPTAAPPAEAAPALAGASAPESKPAPDAPQDAR